MCEQKRSRKYRPTPGGAIGHARYAMEYIDAAMLVARERGERRGVFEGLAPIPAYFLAMHGIELTLKAFLRHIDPSGESASGHDVAALYERAEGMGLATVYRASTIDQESLHLFGVMNRSQALRYFESGLYPFMKWSRIEPFMVRLHQAVGPHVGYTSFDEPNYPDDWAHYLERPEGMTLDELTAALTAAGALADDDEG